MSYINRTSQKWQDGLLLGNGLYGISVYGDLNNETITGNHVDAFLRTDQFDTVPYMADKLEEIRKIIDTQGYKEGTKVFESIAIERGYRGLTMSDYYHPIYTLNVKQKENISCEESRRFYDFNERSGNVESKDLIVKYTLNSNTTVIEMKSTTKRSMQFEFELYSIENIQCEISNKGKEFT
ncbi:MAG: hypothetical protein GX753_06465, partial [Erysipelothrix sp.]|nr:hypothetical protein [Erysipelothrix sp.]